MKYFGLNKELVDDAIIHKTLSTNDGGFEAMISTGRFKLKNNRVFYKMFLLGEGSTEIEVNVNLNEVSLDDLNSDRCYVYFVSYFEKLKSNKIYELILSFGQDEKEAEENANSQLIEKYAEVMNIKSKAALLKIIKDYEQFFEKLKA